MAKRTLLFIVMLGIFGVGLWYVRTHYTPPSANQVDQFTELPLPSPVGKATVVPSPILTPSPGFVTFQLAITAPRVAIPLFSGWIFESSTTTFFYQHNEEVPDVQLRITAAKKEKPEVCLFSLTPTTLPPTASYSAVTATFQSVLAIEPKPDRSATWIIARRSTGDTTSLVVCEQHDGGTFTTQTAIGTIQITPAIDLRTAAGNDVIKMFQEMHVEKTQ